MKYLINFDNLDSKEFFDDEEIYHVVEDEGALRLGELVAGGARSPAKAVGRTATDRRRRRRLRTKRTLWWSSSNLRRNSKGKITRKKEASREVGQLSEMRSAHKGILKR